MNKRKRLKTGSICWLAALVLLLGATTVSANILFSRLEAVPQVDGAILVTWETTTELNSLAFNLYRALSATGPWDQRVDKQEARGDRFTGATYQYRDTNIVPGVRYFYLVEELTATGPGQRTDPVAAMIEPRPTIYLPLILR